MQNYTEGYFYIIYEGLCAQREVAGVKVLCANLIVKWLTIQRSFRFMRQVHLWSMQAITKILKGGPKEF